MDKKQKNPGKGKNAFFKKPTKNKTFTNNFFMGLGILLLLLALFSSLMSGPVTQKFTISDLVSDIKSEKIEKISVDGNDIVATYKENDPNSKIPNTKLEKKTSKEGTAAFVETIASYGVTPEQISKINIDIKQPSGFENFLYNILPILLPILLLVLMAYYFIRSFKGAGVQAMTFGQTTARFTKGGEGKQKVTFKDVAGCREAKQELMEIVDFLKNPKKFLDIGASIPKGILLMGGPGTGKTLLARATAGEAGVSFFSISGSEFVEMFVGVGASRVRDLFRLAKAASPSIIFIDEIDAVGRARGVGVGGGNDEREQTLNQILVEMDGFEQSEKVIVMAATNRPDVLDSAILRPGRFDRRVVIDMPDRRDREEILEIQAKGKPLAEDVNLKVIAERTPGFSGADLYSLVNEAAIVAARENRTKFSQFDFIRSIEKVMLGPERKSHLLTQTEKKITAYHEAGHALVASLLPYADPVHKISIIARGRAGGYTLKLPNEDRKLQSKKEFLDDLAMSLGGYVAEKMVFGDLTTGPSNDLQVSTALARDMVTRFGMSDSIGPIALESSGGQVLFGRGVNEKEYSEKVGEQIDKEISDILHTAKQKATELLETHRKVLDAIANKLMEVETLEKDDYEKLLALHGIEQGKKRDIEHLK